MHVFWTSIFFQNYNRSYTITLGSLWDHFGITLGSLWDYFGITLGSLWDYFGITLGLLWYITFNHLGITLISFLQLALWCQLDCYYDTILMWLLILILQLLNYHFAIMCMLNFIIILTSLWCCTLHKILPIDMMFISFAKMIPTQFTNARIKE
jgi:hypothetical protein